MTCQDYKWDVFICHASEDKEKIAEPLFNRLKNFGLDIWYDEDSIYAGDNIYEKVKEGLNKSLIMILIASKVSLDKNFPNMEIGGIIFNPTNPITLDEIGDRLIPVCYKISLEDASKKIKILGILRDLHIEDNEDAFDKNLDKVIEEIIKKVNITKSKKFNKFPDGLIRISSVYWKKYKMKDLPEIINELKYFFINPASSSGDDTLQKVIANDFYIIPNEDILIQELSPEYKTHKNIDEILFNLKSKQTFKCLIKITGLGGSGKTTYLWHLAKQYYNDYIIYYIDSLKPESLDFIINNEQNDFPLLLIIDSIYNKSNKQQELNDFFKRIKFIDKVILIVSERSDWLDYFEKSFININQYFFYIYEIEFTNSCLNRNKILSKILDLLQEHSFDLCIIDSEKNKFESIILDKKLSLVEAKYLIFKQLKTDRQFCDIFKFEWEDWCEYIDSKDKYAGLKYLYHFISVFQQYGQKVPSELNFKKIFEVEDNTYTLINEAIDGFSKKKSPIFIEDKFLSIRHDKLGELLINNLSSQEINILNNFIENFFNNVSDNKSIYLFRNIHRKNQAFFNSTFFNKYLTLEKRIKILEDYLSLLNIVDYTDNESKCLTELIKSYEELSNDKAIKEKILEKINILIQVEEKLGTNFGKHILVNYIIKYEPDRYLEAENLLKKIEEVEGHTKIIETSFLKLYKKYNPKNIPIYYLNKLKENNLIFNIKEELRELMIKAEWHLMNGDSKNAFKIYYEIIDKYPNDYYSRTKLAQILRKESGKSKNDHIKKRYLKEAKKQLQEALRFNHNNIHTYTELGETSFAMGETEEAIIFLKQGIDNCEDNIACKTFLADIYCKLSKDSKAKKNIPKAIEFLNNSYELLRNIINLNHLQSSIILAKTCMKFYAILEEYPNEAIECKINKSTEEYLKEIENLLKPFNFDAHENLMSNIENINTLKFLLSFYKKNTLTEKFNEISTKILQQETEFDFWFQLLDSYNENEEYLIILFGKILTSKINYSDIYKIINKLNNKNFKFSDCSYSISITVNDLKENASAFKFGNLLLIAYYYSLGALDKCKKAFIRYYNSRYCIDKKQIWESFYCLVTDNRMYINLFINNAKLLKTQEFYFNEAQKIKTMIFSLNQNNSDYNNKTITDYKLLINGIHGISKLKALEKSHKENFGYGCFFVQLILGQIYKSKKFETIDNELKLTIAKNYFENAFYLARENKYSFLKSTYRENINNINYTDLEIEKHYFERLLKDLIECYIHLGSNVLLKRAEKILDNEKNKINSPLYFLLYSKICTKKKIYKLSYISSSSGIKKFRKENKFNPEIHDNSIKLNGELYAELAYCMHKNWNENKYILGNKKLSEIQSFYKYAIKLNPELGWAKGKLKEFEDLL